MVQALDRPAIIYMATSPSGKKYIGITVKSLSTRKSNHLSHAKTKPPHAFQKAILKYGIDNFIWEIIENTSSFEHAKEREKYYIKAYNTKRKGYNRTDGGDGGLGFEPTKEQKERISARLKGNKYCLGRRLTEEHKENLSRSQGGSPIFVYDQYGNIIHKFCSIKECSTIMNIDRRGVANALKGKKITQRGYFFSNLRMNNTDALLYFRAKYDKLRIYTINGKDPFLQQCYSKVAGMLGVSSRYFTHLIKKQSKFNYAGYEVFIQ